MIPYYSNFKFYVNFDDIIYFNLVIIPNLMQGIKMDEMPRIIDLLLQIGKLLLQHGAETEVVESVMKNAAQNLGFRQIEIMVLPNTLVISLSHNGESYNTKLQKVQRQDVNFGAVDKIVDIVSQINKSTNINNLLVELQDETKFNGTYPFYFKNLMVGIGCGSFSLLFGGDLYIFIATFIASYIGFFLNSFLLKRYFNPFVVIVIVSFTTTIISGIMTIHTDISHIALSSAVLFLVPSVAFINSVNDLIKGHYTNGLIRGMRGIIISFAIAIGISIALNILGVENFV